MAKGRFSGPLRLEHIDGRRWLVLDAFEYVSSDAVMYHVDAGVTTDLASIPRVFWRLFPQSGEYNQAGVLHDHLYVQNGVSRARADWVFRDAMHALGVSWATRQAMYLAVRVGGAGIWSRYRKGASRHVEADRQVDRTSVE